MQNSQTVFEKDLIKANNRFPKLLVTQTDTKYWVVTGELDICDIEGNYWGTFDIQIIILKSYPFCIPIVKEVSTLIPREANWHISPSGECCLDITHKLIYKSRIGINIIDFLSNTIYPYFSNQLYKLQTGNYAGSEFAHNCEGIIQFYKEDLDLNLDLSLLILKRLTTKLSFKRNELCFCGKRKKLKNCHLSTINFLNSMGIKQLITDLYCFSIH